MFRCVIITITIRLPGILDCVCPSPRSIGASGQEGLIWEGDEFNVAY